MIVAGFCPTGELTNVELVTTTELHRAYKWLAAQVEDLEDLRREQDLGVRGMMFTEFDAESGDNIIGFVLQASDLDG